VHAKREQPEAAQTRAVWRFPALQQRHAAEEQVGDVTRKGGPPPVDARVPRKVRGGGDGKQQREHEEDQAQHRRTLRTDEGGTLSDKPYQGH
jgi:hypothetical protein